MRQTLGGDEARSGPELDLFGGNADCQHRLPQARRPDQGERPRLTDEGRIEIAQHDLPFELGAEAEVELLDAGGKGEAGRTETSLGSRRRPDRQLLLEHALEEISVAQLFLGSAIHPIVDHGSGAGELELGAQGDEIGAHARTSCTTSTCTQLS
jgi:hypothetical protein